MIARLSHGVPVRTAAATSAFLGLLLLSGCGDGYPIDMAYGVRTDPLVNTQGIQTPPPDLGAPGQWLFLLPTFPGKTLEPDRLSDEQRSQVQQTLNGLFGTPAEPQVAKISGVSDQVLQDLQLDAETLAQGSKLYRRHCLHCHGLTGDGHGPTAAWVNPHPRDYRPGKFKFTSSSQSVGDRKPRRQDLLRVLSNGIEGTSMPAFGLLPRDELEQLASYVMHLSIRGQCEFDTLTEVLPAPEKVSGRAIDTKIRGYLRDVVGLWHAAENKLIEPGKYPYPAVPGAVQDDPERKELAASIARGHKLFLGAQATTGSSCISCHKNYGRIPDLRWDDWGTVVRPADLTTGVYRGGRRPIDIFWRIHSGINGAGMAPYPLGFKPPEEENRDMWDIVNFVLALPYPGMLPPDIRDQVYPPPEPSGTQTARVD